MSEQDASEMGIKDNDWVEVYNDHGVYCTRAVVSSRIPKGVCIVYHVPERTVGIPSMKHPTIVIHTALPLDFALSHFNSSMSQLAIHSTMAIAEVMAATVTRKKNRLPKTIPPGIFPKTFGNVTKISL